MYTTVDPIQPIQAEGFAYRSAVDGPPKLIILVGMWFLFAPTGAGGEGNGGSSSLPTGRALAGP